MTTLPLLLASFVAAPGGIVAFQGLPGGSGSVVVVDPTGALPPITPPGLSGITLLPLDFNGRVELDALRGDRPRWRNDVPGASRVELPGGAGSLYRFSRPDVAGVKHGLFIVDAAGEARVVLELLGVGPASDQSPFLPRVACSPSGSHALVLTKFDAGGDALEIDLASGATINRTSNVAAQRFVVAGAHLADTFGTAATSQAIWRFDRTNAADATQLALPGTPAWCSGEIALSRNGAFAVTTAGVSEDLAHVFVFSATGSAVQVTTAPTWVSSAGYLPEHLHGPFLAVSDSGSHCAWRTEGVAREAWLAPVPQGAAPQPHWLTSDTNYIDTIDEIGQFMFRIGGEALVYSAGELATTGAPVIEKVDFYEAQLPSGSTTPTLLNLTQTNGIAAPPYLLAASLDPSFVMREPASGAVLFHNQMSGGTGELLGVAPGQVGFTVLVPAVDEVRFIERAGSHVFVDLVRSTGPQNRELHHFTAPFVPSAAPLFSVAATHSLGRTAARSDGWFAFVETTPVKERLWRFDPLSSALQRLTDRALFYGPAIDWAPGGELAFTVGAGGASSIFAAWSTAAPVRRLPLGTGPGFVLP
jgi:hypothetical protein